MIVGYHASHEQFPPERLVHLVQQAEGAGFHWALCSDHLSPFLPEQGHSGFAWSWLGAAMQATRIPFGTVSAPGWRYHPAVLAQAAATLERMFPDRFFLALGSGEALNEHVTGEAWPDKPARNERLRECQDAMRRLLAGGTVDQEGHVPVREARLWSLPERPPPLMAAAMSPETAAFAASWGEGLITVNQPAGRLQKIVRAYRDHGGHGPLVLQVQLSWNEDEAKALQVAHRQWRFSALDPETMESLRTPDEIVEATRDVDPEDLRDPVVVLDDLGRLEEPVEAWRRMGFERVALHHVGPDQQEFIDAVGKRLLPRLEAPAHA